jgi:hypothetical protein
MMILLVSLICLLGSFFLSWYVPILLAAALYSFRKQSFRELLSISLGIFVLHFFAALLLDQRSGWLLSQRFTALLGLPHWILFSLLSALMPALLFAGSGFLIFQSRTLVKSSRLSAEKKV